MFPPRCPVCEALRLEAGTVCKECQKILPYVKEPKCKKCSKPLAFEETEYCDDCKKKTFSFECGQAVWVYNRLMAQAIGRFKYNDKKEYALFFGREIVRLHGGWIQRNEIEAFVPVPIHRTKRNQRGYNQSELIASVISEEMEIQTLPNAIRRVRKTRPQKELSGMERVRNLDQAFVCRLDALSGYKRVALVDDIYTTGSTIEACARALKDSGVKEVYFLSVCIGVNI